MDRRQFLSLAAVAGAFEFADARALCGAEAPQTVAVDYAYYNPVSLLLARANEATSLYPREWAISF